MKKTKSTCALLIMVIVSLFTEKNVFGYNDLKASALTMRGIYFYSDDYIDYDEFTDELKELNLYKENISVYDQNGNEVFSGLICTGFSVYGIKIAIKGDTDGNGKIDTTDIVLIKRHLLKIKLLFDEYECAADFDNNGELDCTDYLTIKRVILKISSQYPKSKLIVKGKEINSGNYVSINYKDRYAEIPLVTVLNELGVKMEWQDETTATLIVNDRPYTLNLTEKTLYDNENGINILLPVPGSWHKSICKTDKNELIVDTDLAYDLIMIRLEEQIIIDYKNGIVYIGK